MNPEQQIREWIQNRGKLVKSFYNTAIEKDLNLDKNTVADVLVKLTIDDTLKLLYHYDCDCGYSDITKNIGDLIKTCPWCDKDINLKEVYLEFEIIRKEV